MNEIYSIMENVARINLFMFEESHDIPPKYTKQTNKIKNGKLSLNPKYDKLILEEIEWYNQVNTIRDNVNHFLTGIAVFNRLDDNTIVPQYFNYNMSERNQHNININDENEDNEKLILGL
ncbi:hypothetical protein [uncultured Methanomethylovorans sp.]|uniref:hypothetical protein n=1 Tax=uncultured Methanomethylovorans sp. TaxID=183759 RepID=UPI003748DD25